MAIGINYLVMNVYPQCVNLAEIQLNIQTSFINNLLPLLCSCGYQYYSPKQPTTYFYTLDFIGQIDRSEVVLVNLIERALDSAWSNQYNSKNGLSSPILIGS